MARPWPALSSDGFSQSGGTCWSCSSPYTSWHCSWKMPTLCTYGCSCSGRLHTRLATRCSRQSQHVTSMMSAGHERHGLDVMNESEWSSMYTIGRSHCTLSIGCKRSEGLNDHHLAWKMPYGHYLRAFFYPLVGKISNYPRRSSNIL